MDEYCPFSRLIAIQLFAADVLTNPEHLHSR